MPCSYVPIYDTPNSIHKSMVDRDTILGKELWSSTFKMSLILCGYVATLTHEKRENFGPVICENINAKIVFTCCSAKISYCENFHVYGNWVCLSMDYLISIVYGLILITPVMLCCNFTLPYI